MSFASLFIYNFSLPLKKLKHAVKKKYKITIIPLPRIILSHFWNSNVYFYYFYMMYVLVCVFSEEDPKAII